MNPMKTILSLSAASLMLVACDSGGSDDGNKEIEQAAEKTAASDLKDKVVETAKEMLKLDTSTLDSFTSSLSAMKGSLSTADAGKLTDAITALAKDTASDSGSMLDAAKNLASGDSPEEVVYKAMGDKLDGMTFDDIMKLVD